METTQNNPPVGKSPTKPDNRSVVLLLLIVLTAILVLGWYAFFSGPSVETPVKPAAAQAPVSPVKVVSPKPVAPRATAGGKESATEKKPAASPSPLP